MKRTLLVVFLLLGSITGCSEVDERPTIIETKCFIAEKNKNHSETFKWCSKAAKQGNARAQNVLGMIYFEGQGVTQDYKQAVKWYTLAAEQGDANSQFTLGLIYKHGTGVTQDYKQVFKWYTLAAEQGDASAQNNLGVMYYNGKGVTQDNIYAHMWFNIASSNGSGNASENRDILAQKMTKEQIVEAQKLARECVAKNYKGC